MTDEQMDVNRKRYRRYEAIRDDQGLKDADVAKKACISQSVLSDWKAGRATPGFSNIVSIANALGVSANEFDT